MNHKLRAQKAAKWSLVGGQRAKKRVLVAKVGSQIIGTSLPKRIILLTASLSRLQVFNKITINNTGGFWRQINKALNWTVTCLSIFPLLNQC